MFRSSGPWNFEILIKDSDTGSPSLVAVRMKYWFAYQFWYWELWMENLWGGEWKHYFVNFFLRACFSCRWVRFGAVGFIYQSAFTNSMHVQSTYTPYLQYLQSEEPLEFSLGHTYSRRLQDVFKTSCKNIFKISSRRLQDVFKTSSKHLQDIFKTSCKDLFKTFSKRIIKLNCSC